MESLQERNRKNFGSGYVADGENQLNEKFTGEKPPKLSKMEFFSQDKPWRKCINLNISINTEKTISNSDEECSPNSSGISSVDSKEHDEESTSLQSFKQSNVDSVINEDGEKSSYQGLTNTETMVLNSGEKCSVNSSGIISMEIDKHNEESTKLLEPNRKDDKKCLDKELPADSSAFTSIKYDQHESSFQDPNLASFAAMASEKYSDMSPQQQSAWIDAIKIRDGIKFFLTNGYFKKSYIKTFKNVYKMFVKFFHTNLKHLTPISHGMEITDKDEGKKVTTDTLFKDDEGRIFMYFWTTTGSDITEEYTNNMREYYVRKVNGHRRILEKPENGYNMKISDTFLVRLNPYTDEVQIGKFDRIVDNEILQQIIRDCR